MAAAKKVSPKHDYTKKSLTTWVFLAIRVLQSTVGNK